MCLHLNIYMHISTCITHILLISVLYWLIYTKHLKKWFHWKQAHITRFRSGLKNAFSVELALYSVLMCFSSQRVTVKVRLWSFLICWMVLGHLEQISSLCSKAFTQNTHVLMCVTLERTCQHHISTHTSALQPLGAVLLTQSAPDLQHLIKSQWNRGRLFSVCI